LFSSRVTVARDTTAANSAPVVTSASPRNQADARTAFDNLFKK